MGERNVAAEQIGHEQRSVDAMYAHLDTELHTRVSAQERTLAAPVDGPQEIYARDLEIARLAERIRQLRAAERSLCFGRIDRVGDGGSMHVGRLGLRTEAGEVLLLDWRADAARPFYSATPAAPLGVRRRRHLRTQGCTVLDVSDEILDGSPPSADDVVGDSPLVAALSGARTGRMKEAAATLQAEQDDIVRSAHRGVLVVDGGPGTGKTIVALHRAAYVLYEFRSVAERGVLVFGPNQRFLTYISDVLPSLGENDVRLASMPDLIGLEATTTEPDHIARIKGRSEFASGLAEWVRSRQPYGAPLELGTAYDAVVLDASSVDAARRRVLQGGVGHNRARGLFLEHVVDDLVSELEQRTAKELADFDDELEAMLGIDLDRMVAGDLRRVSSDDLDTPVGVDIDWSRIREDLLDDRGIERAVDRVWPRLRAEDVVRDFLADRAALARVLPDVSAEDIDQITHHERAGWSAADLALVDEARGLVDGPPETTYGHIVVDEAQQLTQMQWRMLMRRCPDRSMTVVGDLAQAGPTTTIGSWHEALAPFVDDRFAHHTLTINYRTTAEILQASRPLLARIAPDQRLSRSVRHGEPPRVFSVAQGDIVCAVADLIARITEEQPGELVGVVTPAEQALALETALESALPDARATVIGAPEARGLEFDTVIIVDPVAIRSANEAGLRDLYVAQTRATKNLVTLEPEPGGAIAVE